MSVYFRTASLFLLLTVFAGVIMAQNKETSVSGRFISCKSQKASLYSTMDGSSLLAEAVIDTAGNFEMLVSISQPDIYKLQFNDGVYLSLIILPGDKIHMTADMADLISTLQITGSESTGLVYESGKQLNAYKNKLDSINQQYYQLLQTGIDDSVKNLMVQDYTMVDNQQKAYIEQFVRNHHSCLCCLFIIDKLPIDDYFETYEVLDQGLFKAFPENQYVKNFHNRVESNKKLAIGAEAPEIELPGPEGDPIKLSSLRGNVVLIDFWASWCSPCRKENPNMVKLYNSYHSKGFEIFSVSLDKTKDAWTKAIKDDGLVWTHVSDLKFWQCEAALAYNVTAVPYTVLIDREGKILAKGLRGTTLEEKIHDLLQ